MQHTSCARNLPQSITSYVLAFGQTSQLCIALQGCPACCQPHVLCHKHGNVMVLAADMQSRYKAPNPNT